MAGNDGALYFDSISNTVWCVIITYSLLVMVTLRQDHLWQNSHCHRSHRLVAYLNRHSLLLKIFITASAQKSLHSSPENEAQAQSKPASAQNGRILMHH